MRQLRGTTLALAAAGCLSLGAFTTPALAQSAIEEIVVTAQKREENIGDVPVAITVLGRDLIESSFADNIEDLQALVPSVSFRTGNTTRNSALTVRGIGTISFSVAAEPSVSTVVDGVVLGRSGQAFGDLYDLERVEVLRGPQGTLFGKNASAGVVNITTRRPSDALEGYLSTSFYEDDEYVMKGRVSGPVTDNLRASLTVLNAEFDGFVTNVFNNEQVQGYDKTAIRAMLDYDVDEDTSILFIFEDYEADNDCCADLELRPSGRNPASEAAPIGAGLDLDNRLIDHDFETRTLDSTTAMSLQIETGISDFMLTSITAQRTWENTEFREGDFTSIAGDSNLPVFGVPFQLHDIGPQEWRQFSQEVRLASPVGETFEYQVGFFYMNIEASRNFTRFASCQNNNGQLDAAITNHLGNTLGLPNDPAAVAAFIAANGITCNANDIVDATAFFDADFENVAVFGQGTWNINDDLRLIAGLRYTRDDVAFNHNRRNNDVFGRRGVGVRPRFSDGNNQFDTNFSGETDETDLSGKIGLQWDMDHGGMLYGTYAQGYKGPAFNVFFNMDPDDINPIDAESSDALELGYKLTADWGLLSFAVYQTDFENFQANDFDTSDGTTVTGFTNGGDVTTSGFEADFIWQVSEQFLLSGGVAFSNAETDTGDSFDLPFAPDTKYALAGQYDFPLANGGTIELFGTYVFTDEALSGNIGQTESTNPEVVLPDYGILNASIGYHAPDDKFSVTFIARNLTDEQYVTTYSGDGFRYQVPRDADRYFGLNATLNFGAY